MTDRRINKLHSERRILPFRLDAWRLEYRRFGEKTTETTFVKPTNKQSGKSGYATFKHIDQKHEWHISINQFKQRALPATLKHDKTRV